MKKIMAVIATILALIPFVGVKAVTESTNYYEYKKGEVVNFYSNTNEEESKMPKTGNTTIILDDKGASDMYVKVLMIGLTYDKINSFKDDLDPAATFPKGSEALGRYASLLRTAKGVDDTEYYYNFEDAEKGLSYITLDEMLALIGEGNYQYNAQAKKYTVNGDVTLKARNGEDTSLFEAMTIVASSGGPTSNSYKGFYTSTLDGDKVWVVKFATTTVGDEYVVNGMTIEQVEATDNNEYAIVGTGYANKTKDCHQVSYVCYVCGTDYKYAVEGSQDDSCKVVPNVTNPEDCVPKACYNCDGTYKWYKDGEQDDTICTKVDNVTSEANCVVSPKTGIESHLLEFAIVAALCAIALLVVRRRDLFRTI